jgi:hypothetical protein
MKELEKSIMALYKKIIICKAFNPRSKSPRYSLDRRVGEPQNRSGRCGEEKYLAPAGNPTQAVQPVARRDTTDTGVIRIPTVSQVYAPAVLPPEKEPTVLILSFCYSG